MFGGKPTFGIPGKVFEVRGVALLLDHEVVIAAVLLAVHVVHGPEPVCERASERARATAGKARVSEPNDAPVVESYMDRHGWRG